jgi:hypothetical protein
VKAPRWAAPFDPHDNSIPQHCFVHHLPNSHADNPASSFGKLAVPDGLLAPLRPTARTVLDGLVGPIFLAGVVGLGRVWVLERAVVRLVWPHLARRCSA